MDWRMKLIGQKVLGGLPGTTGLRLHHVVQSRLGMIGDMSEEMRIEFFGRSIENCQFLINNSDFQFAGKKVIEVGTGWHMSDSILFHLLGASEIHTCDILPHLESRLVFSMLETARQSISDIADGFGVERDLLDERAENMLRANSLSELLSNANIHYHAPVWFHRWKPPQNDFDLFFSHSVLQRVPLPELAQYLSVARQALGANGLSCHVLHHNDHNFRHDSNIGELHYLRYSDRAYNLLQSRKFNFQNRMRHGEFLEFFKANGFQNIGAETVTVTSEAAGELKLAERFKSIPLDDLLITRTHLLSQLAS